MPTCSKACRHSTFEVDFAAYSESTQKDTRQPENRMFGFQAAFGYGKPANQPETFAKPTTDGASAARRYFGKSVTPCLIIHLAANRRRSIWDFRLLLGFCKGLSLKAEPSQHPYKRRHTRAFCPDSRLHGNDVV